MKPLTTVLVGFGKIAQGYSKDLFMKRHFSYATHAEVLRDHPSFAWLAVVDPDPLARECAKKVWKIKTVAKTPAELGNHCRNAEILILATPAKQRIGILKYFPHLRAVFVEKPLGIDLKSSKDFLKECKRKNIFVQVNFWRRGDRQMRSLASGELVEYVGDLQAAFGVYGNGLLNNAIHMVDLVRMLFGEVKAVQRLCGKTFCESPITGDFNLPFFLQIERGPPTVLEPIRFRYYRENGLDIWGTKGRMEILNEGLTIRRFKSCTNRAMSGEREVDHDRPLKKNSAAGYALYALYSNLAEALKGQEKLWSSGDSALRTSEILEAIRFSSEDGRLCPV